MFFKSSIKSIMLRNVNKCNAHCLHCNIDETQIMSKTLTIKELDESLDKMKYYVSDRVQVVWEGGEVLLLPVSYYYEAYKVFKKYFPNCTFSMQTNFLKYDVKVDKMFKDIFNYNVSTSYDFFSSLRNIRGNSEKYKTKFFQNIKDYQDRNKYKPFIINIINSENQDKYNEIFDLRVENQFNIRLNHLYILGNAIQNKHLEMDISKYTLALKVLTERWLREDNNIILSPSLPLLEKYLFNKVGVLNECPFTSKCTGRFIALEPNGDVTNCIEFTNTNNYKFGNIFTDEISKVFHNKNVVSLSKRSVNLHEDCKKCRFLYACQGGCMATTYIETNDIYGKFPQCDTYMSIFEVFEKFDKEYLKSFYTHKNDNFSLMKEHHKFKPLFLK